MGNYHRAILQIYTINQYENDKTKISYNYVLFILPHLFS